MTARAHSIGIVVFDGVEDLDFVGPWEVLRAAAGVGAPIRVGLVSAGELELTSAHGMRFRADGRLDDAESDLLVVPGGGWASDAPEGVAAQVARGALCRRIADAHASGTVVASVCTGAMLLGAAGLLKGRPAVTHHLFVDDLARFGATVVDAHVVDDGDVLTSSGVVAGIDLALYLTERLLGPEILALVEREIEYHRREPHFCAGRLVGARAGRTRAEVSSGSSFETDIGYARAVAAGDLVHVSGTTGFDYRAMTIADDVATQAEQAMANVGAALASLGCSFADVVRVRYMLADPDEFEACWPVLRGHLGEARPAATMIACALIDARVRIEIEVTALRPAP